MTIHELEDSLFERWENSYQGEDKKSFCRDGLCYNGEYNPKTKTCSPNNEELLWKNAKRKVVFLLKDNNGNDGEDTRYWGWRGAPLAPIYQNLYRWLEGLNTVRKDHPTSFKDGDYSTTSWDVVMDKYPFIPMNIKKLAGGSRVSDSVLWEAAERDQGFLREQINIYRPNIVVCCGGGRNEEGGALLRITKKIIFPKTPFNLVSNRVYLNEEQNLMLLDVHHPSIISDEEFWSVIDNVYNALQIIEPGFMK
jgi:hypothetical protein